MSKGILKICDKGHRFYKSSDCPVCPICEAEHKPESGFLSVLSAPARRALENNGMTTLKRLAKFTEAQLLRLHGIGPSSIPILRKALSKQGLSFQKDKTRSLTTKNKKDVKN